VRLPYLQVSSDAWGKARELGAVLGCGRHNAMSMMLDMWHWALDLEADGKVTGIIQGKRAAERLAGALEWSMDASELVDAMCEVGLLERLPDGYRVRGMDRYDQAFERQEKERTRKAAWRASRDMSRGQDGDKGGTDTGQYGDKRQNVPHVPAADVDVDVDVDVKNNLTTPPRAKAAENGSELRTRLSSVFEEVRGTPYVFTSEEEMTTGRRLLQLAQGERQQKDDEIVRRWRNALTRTRFPTADSLKDLVKHWNAYATEQPAAPAQQHGKPTAHQRPGGIDGLTKAPTTGSPCEWTELTNCNGIGVGDSGGKWLCASCLKTSNDYFAGLNKH